MHAPSRVDLPRPGQGSHLRDASDTIVHAVTHVANKGQNLVVGTATKLLTGGAPEERVLRED